jgi:hypothetical protein
MSANDPKRTRLPLTPQRRSRGPGRLVLTDKGGFDSRDTLLALPDWRGDRLGSHRQDMLELFKFSLCGHRTKLPMRPEIRWITRLESGKIAQTIRSRVVVAEAPICPLWVSC